MYCVRIVCKIYSSMNSFFFVDDESNVDIYMLGQVQYVDKLKAKFSSLYSKMFRKNVCVRQGT